MAKQPADHIWFNGEIKPWKEATVHVMTHAIHYGSSVFEGIRAYNTPDKGTCVFRLNDHNRRLFDSAKIYRMTIPYTLEEVNQATIDIIAKNNLKSAYIRPIACDTRQDSSCFWCGAYNAIADYKNVFACAFTDVAVSI